MKVPGQPYTHAMDQSTGLDLLAVQYNASAVLYMIVLKSM